MTKIESLESQVQKESMVLPNQIVVLEPTDEDLPTDISLEEGYEAKEDSSLSSGELNELNVLVDRQEKGEEVDEDRLYELDILDLWHSGKDLNYEEKTDLEVFKARRQEERQYKRELKDLMNRRKNGEVIDEALIYGLELQVRKDRGETLSANELLDLKSFKRKEERAAKEQQQQEMPEDKTNNNHEDFSSSELTHQTRLLKGVKKEKKRGFWGTILGGEKN